MKKLTLLAGLCVFLACFSQNDVVSSGIEKKKIISLAPSTTEILFSLGLDDEIIGTSTFCNYPPQANNKEKVGTFSQPNIEKILSLQPDMIFATSLEQALVVEKLKQLRLNVYVMYPSNLKELFMAIEKIGELTSREKQARQLIMQMQYKIRQIEEKVKSIPQDKRPKVFIEIWHDPLITAGRGSFVDELISIAGGCNIAYDAPRAYSYFSAEQVIKRNPDYIIFGHRSKNKAIDIVKKRLGWKKIKAVKNNCVYNDINPDLFLRPGPRIIKGLEEIYHKLYPQ